MSPADNDQFDEDPLDLFRSMEPIEVSEDEVRVMQERVLAVARWQSLGKSDRNSESEAVPGEVRSADPRGWMGLLAAALVVGIIGLAATQVGTEQPTELTVATGLESVSQLPLIEDDSNSDAHLSWQVTGGDIDFAMIHGDDLEMADLDASDFEIKPASFGGP